MNITARNTAVLGSLVDPRPRLAAFVQGRVQGEAGTAVQVIRSREFVAGVSESGVTEVSVFVSDTLDVVLPLDETYDISIQRRFFIQVLPQDTLEAVTARVIVNVDGRNLFDDRGTLPLDPPFRYVYVFNQRTTRVIDVI